MKSRVRGRKGRAQSCRKEWKGRMMVSEVSIPIFLVLITTHGIYIELDIINKNGQPPLSG